MTPQAYQNWLGRKRKYAFTYIKHKNTTCVKCEVETLGSSNMATTAKAPLENLLSLANYSVTPEQETGEVTDGYLPYEKDIEGLVMMTAGSLGIFLNLLILILTCSCSHLRIMMNGFTIHGCILEMIKVRQHCICILQLGKCCLFNHV